VKERVRRIGYGWWLQAALLALQLSATEERGTTAPALANGDPGRSGDGELAPGEMVEVACGWRLPG
jgi:hypothetical protein